MPKIKIRAVGQAGHWIVDSAEHQKRLDDYKQKTGWVQADQVQKMVQQGIPVPAHMMVEPIMAQLPGKFIPGDETEMDVTDEELKALQGNPHVMVLTGQQSQLEPKDQDRIKRQQEAERAENERQGKKH